MATRLLVFLASFGAAAAVISRTRSSSLRAPNDPVKDPLDEEEVARAKLVAERCPDNVNNDPGDEQELECVVTQTKARLVEVASLVFTVQAMAGRDALLITGEDLDIEEVADSLDKGMRISDITTALTQSVTLSVPGAPAPKDYGFAVEDFCKDLRIVMKLKAQKEEITEMLPKMEAAVKVMNWICSRVFKKRWSNDWDHYGDNVRDGKIPLTKEVAVLPAGELKDGDTPLENLVEDVEEFFGDLFGFGDTARVRSNRRLRRLKRLVRREEGGQ